MQSKSSKKGWREWSAQEGKWVTRPDAGVENRGKVRPKVPPTEKAVQAVCPMESKASQTELEPVEHSVTKVHHSILKTGAKPQSILKPSNFRHPEEEDKEFERQQPSQLSASLASEPARNKVDPSPRSRDSESPVRDHISIL